MKETKFLSTLASASRDGDKLKTSLCFALKSFGDPDLSFTPGEAIEGLRLPPADITFLTLVAVCGESDFGREEKVAWTVPFSFKGVTFAFSLRKFGLFLLLDKRRR